MRPPEQLRRDYKPLESELLELPASLVDALEPLNLGVAADHFKAHELCDLVPADEDEHFEDHLDRLGQYHRVLWRLAEKKLIVADELKRLAGDRDRLAAEVQAGWSQHHRDKQNCYYAPPLTLCQPLAKSGNEPPAQILERVDL